MNGFFTEPVVLSGGQSSEFIASLRRPDQEYLARRNELFAGMDKEISIQRAGMDIEVEIPGLDLSFISGKTNDSGIRQELLSMVVSYVLNGRDVEYKFVGETGRSSYAVVTEGYDCGGRTDYMYYSGNGAGKNRTEASVKDKNSESMMKTGRVEQIILAA